MDADRNKGEAAVEHLKNVILASAKLNVNMVTTFIGRDQTKTVEENLLLVKKVWEPVIRLAEENHVPVSNLWSKSEIAAFLMDAIGVEKLANACSHMGVSSYPFQQKFGITGNDVKQFAKRGLLKITGNERFLSHGEAHYASLYSVVQYYTLTLEQVQEWKMEV